MAKPDVSGDIAIESFIAMYKDAVREAELAITEAGRGTWQSLARQLRTEWQQFSGDDDLHEIAYGEP